MSSFYDDASLVVIPSGYKTSKVYAEKPTDGSGDLAFTRTGDTATRVNSAGLIEKVRTNLILRSEAFDNASWTKSGVGTFTSAITTGFTDPTGGTNAQRYLATIASVSDRAFVRQLATLTNGIPYAISFWVKSNTGSSQNIYFMFQGGAVQATTVTTSWQRISYSATTSTTSVLVGIEAKDLTTDILIYGFQLEVGDVMTAYIPTTTAAVSVGPVANVPRLDYLGSTCGKLLLEPQRTNLVTFSEQLDNAAWTKNQSTITANAVVSPDGYTNADALVGNGANSIHTAFQQRTATASSIHSISVYLKQGTERYAYLLALGRSVTDDNGDFAWFDLQLGTIGLTSGSGSSATITSVGNGWYRVTMLTSEYPSSTQIEFRVGLSTTPGAQTSTATGFIYVWGAQLEQGAYATSIIPTLAASATRGADDCVKSSATSIIGQTEGVVYFEWEYQNVGSSSGSIPICLDGGAGSEIYFYVQTNGVYLCEGFNALTPQFNFTGSMGSFGTKKIAIAYKNNDFALYINGVLSGTDTSGTVPTLNRLYLGRFYANTNYNIASGINQALLFKTRLTNSELAELTSL